MTFTMAKNYITPSIELISVQPASLAAGSGLDGDNVHTPGKGARRRRNQDWDDEEDYEDTNQGTGFYYKPM